MPFELHVWGPGFGLPSIDAECLSAISYLRHCIAEQDWIIVANSDPGNCPLGELPSLKDGSSWVSGFENIVNYLREVSNGEWDLNKSLNRQQTADYVAFTSFIESRGQPLLDLSLYVESENYNASTKVALSNVLTWPGSWMIPGKLRSQAKRRSEHLGLSSLDMNTALHDIQKRDAGLTAQIPERLRKPKQTVSASLGKNAAKDKFRLDAVTAEFMEPVQELLGRKEYLLEATVTAIDCLAIGYLALMYQPDLPHAWLKDALRKQYKDLGVWTIRLTKASFDNPLPWLKPEPITATKRAATVVENLVEALPLIGRRTSTLLPHSMPSESKGNRMKKQEAIRKIQRDQWRFDQIVFSTVGFGAFLGYMMWTGLLTLPRRAIKPSRRDFGAAGAMLGLGIR